MAVRDNLWGYEYVKMRMIMAGSFCGLKDDDVPNIEFDVIARVENIVKTSISCPHERVEQKN